MSIADKFRRLFNIGVDEDTDENAADGQPSLYGDDPETTTAEAPPVDSTPAGAGEVLAVDPQMQASIFDGVLKVFNATLPDFLQRSIDPEAQRRALLDSLDASITEYLASLTERSDRLAAARLREAADQARAESEKLRSKMDSVEMEKNRIREQQLSADRRRRALDERVRDLEAQIEKADADAEQLRLENQSLVNKLKVADIQPGVVDELNEQIRTLRAQLDGQPPMPDTEALDAAKARIADLETGAELNKSMIGQLEERLAEECRLKEEETRLKEENATKLADAKKELADAKKELDEAAKIVEIVEKLKSQIEGVQDVIAKRDEKISRLRSANKKLKETIAQLEKDLRLQRQVAPAGLFALDNDEEITVSDDDFQCPEWFVSEPEPGMGRIKSDLDDFGYQEPPKKPKAPENDAQLSLF